MPKQNVVKRDAMERKACCHVANAFFSRLSRANLTNIQPENLLNVQKMAFLVKKVLGFDGLRTVPTFVIAYTFWAIYARHGIMPRALSLRLALT